MPAARRKLAVVPIKRDADRISAVFKQAEVSVLDWMVITHYHGDHVGNAAELANRIPIRHFVDHGPFSVELQPNRAAGFLAYMAVRERVAPSRRNQETGFRSPVWTCRWCPRQAS